jgi:hypothetical protein
MIERNDGGSAFPAPDSGRDANGNPAYCTADVMPLRDRFAGHALAGLIVKGTYRIVDADKPSDGENSLSKMVYIIADAMLRARRV